MDVNILWVILVGIIVGMLARLLMPGRDPIGFVMTAVIGIAGALIGTYLWDEVIFKDSDNEGVAILAGVVVAMILLFLYRQMTYGRNRTH
ncbi:MAG: GlsB/YeaQ/YmgE family stress response membrane protein [Actinomycetota bacterium]|nr:GlsB/YeaQ/YmgE family stress response membrane protein [Actinomycetota bacterium]